jgi:thymidylate synthase (FAD)
MSLMKWSLMSDLRVKLIFNTPLDPIKSVFRQKGIEFQPEMILDHVYYMFEIEGCSRVTSHQLVRHRVASYDQESQRFSAATKEGFIIPLSIASNSAALSVYKLALEEIYKAFEKLTALGVPKEDARYLLPSALKTKLVMTVSARSLMHIFWLRSSLQAQWEIRELVNVMCRLAKESTPELWEKMIQK